MKDLEKSFQDSFQNFEPEVRPEVWQKLESSLNAAGSAAAGTKAAVSGAKGLAIKASTWVWIAAATISASIGTVLIFSSDKEVAKPVVENVVTPEVVITNVNPILQETNTAENVVENSHSVNADHSSDKFVNGSVNKDVNSNENSSPVSEGNRSDQGTQETPITKSSSLPSTDPSAQDQSEESSMGNPVDDVTILDKDIPPAIILKSICGFAPFKVTALLNKENLAGTWDFGDGYATSKSNTASHTYNRPGVYEIQCEASGQKLTRTIEVIGTLVTAFSPNGDGQNDEFFIEGAFLEEISLKIFNRSGKMEFEITEPGQRWDGKDENGRELPKGTYFYDIFARSKNGQTINQKGTINLFR